jgi:hypothetical protein
MNRRQIIHCFVCGLGLLSLTGASAKEPASQTDSEKPNVVLIMTDDQGYGDLACHGHPFLKTPNLDKLHGNSVRLTNYHVSSVCSPARAALMTGRHCRHVGVSGTGSGEQLISRGIPIAAEIFTDNGYRTGAFGKWHLRVSHAALAGSGRPADFFRGRSASSGQCLRGTKMVPGNALPVVKARLQVADFDKTINVTDNMLEAKFAVQLKTGKHDIHTEFLDEGGNGFGVHYLYVMRR